MTTPLPVEHADDAVRAWFPDRPVGLVPLTGGLINGTWRVDGPPHPGDPARPLGVLQRVNGKAFRPPVNADLDRVSTHVAARGLRTPRLQPTPHGDRWLPAPGDDSWRLLTWLPGQSFDRFPSDAHARSGGRMVGRWHAAVADLDPASFEHVRDAPHDTDKHLAVAIAAIEDHPGDPLRDAVAPLVDALAERWHAVRPLLPVDPPTRVIHGDLKASNLRFDDAGEAIALLDLDTCAASTLDIELGDLLRSWTATGLEDDPALDVDPARWSAALTGYAQGAADAPPTDAEWAGLWPGAVRITTELGLRFAGDVLRETYFGWDDTRYPRAGAHHLKRTRAQRSLSDALWRRRDDLQRRLDAARQPTESP